MMAATAGGIDFLAEFRLSRTLKNVTIGNSNKLNYKLLIKCTMLWDIQNPTAKEPTL